MAVPDFQTLMRPVLVALADGEDHQVSGIRSTLAEHFSLSDEDLAEMLPSGRVTTFLSRVSWAVTYLHRTKLIDRPRRAVYRITDRGRQVLSQHPERVDLKVLAQFAELEEFRRSRVPEAIAPTITDDVDALPPDERMHDAHQELQAALAAELLDRVSEQPPQFLERVVLDVLQAMGYGGDRADAAERLGQSGDEGVDGVIREDPLGLDLIYVQAKRWQGVVGRPEIQRFVGALHGKRAAKGVFITTSSFSREAVDYADGVTPRVILVDGKELAQLMIEHCIGVTLARQYRVNRIDLDFFVVDDEHAEALPPNS